MGYPQESLENTINTMGTLLGVRRSPNMQIMQPPNPVGCQPTALQLRPTCK